MPHPYFTRREEETGFLGFFCLFRGYAALTGEPRIAELRHRALSMHDATVVYWASYLLLLGGITSLAYAVYSQARFGPSIRSVARPDSAWPPRGFLAWFGIVIFVLVALLMAAIVLIHVVLTFGKT